MGRRAAAAGWWLCVALVVAGCRGGGEDGGPTPAAAPTSTPTSGGTAGDTAGGGSSTTAPGVALSSVRWDEVELPLECGDERNRAEAVSVVRAQPAAGADVVVVLAACGAGAGSPPRTVLVYQGADDPTRPRLRQTLWEDGANRLTSGIVAAAGELIATGGTYSAPEVARCCPDGAFTTRWQWSDDGYAQVSTTAPPPASWGGGS